MSTRPQNSPRRRLLNSWTPPPAPQVRFEGSTTRVLQRTNMQELAPVMISSCGKIFLRFAITAIGSLFLKRHAACHVWRRGSQIMLIWRGHTRFASYVTERTCTMKLARMRKLSFAAYIRQNILFPLNSCAESFRMNWDLVGAGTGVLTHVTTRCLIPFTGFEPN